MNNLCVVTVVDSVSPTSMPINEFVIYRDVHNYPMRQILLVMDKSMPDSVQFSDRVRVHLVGNDKNKIRTIVKEIQEECKHNGEAVVYHMHAQKSAITFLLATIGLGIGKKSLYTVHSTYADRDLKYKLTSCFCSMSAKYANCVSHSAYKQYNGLVKRLKGKRMIGIPNGVDFVRIDESLKDLPDHNSVCSAQKWACVGRIIPIKNQKFLVDLLIENKDANLVLIGAEDSKYDVRNYARERGVLDRIIFTGLMPRNDVFRTLNECGMYVSSSTVEGLPVSVLEAMSVGLIPSLSDIAPHEEIADSCGIFRALPLDKDVWTKNLEAYRMLSNEDFTDLADRVKASVRKNYSLESMHKSYMDIYNKIIRK